MAIIREDGAIVVRKKENGKTKLKHFENMDELIRKMTVSYTHLTLPTICSV